MKKLRILPPREDERGATVIIVAVFLLLAGIGFAALAIDISYIHVVRNELQNAADAGALAGARVLLSGDGTINTSLASDTAQTAAQANKSGGNPVECECNGEAGEEGNGPDVIRGHWSFAEGFTPNHLPEQGDLFDIPADELDTDISFINAVKVVTHNTSIPSFFGRIFGKERYERSAHAVAYRGFAGEFSPGDFDQPIAICQTSIKNPSTGKIECNIGRMLNSSPHITSDTAAWTNFTQDPCHTAEGGPGGEDKPNKVQTYICADGNPDPVVGGGMGTTNGNVSGAYDAFKDCWLVGQNAIAWDEETGEPTDWEDIDQKSWNSETGALEDGDDGIPDRPWNLVLPVIECAENSISNCETVIGAIKIIVVWVNRGGVGHIETPSAMYHPGKDEWFVREADESDDSAWDRFVELFDLKDLGGASVGPPADFSVYFLPACEETTPLGGPGGEFFGVFSEIPKLVQ